jgi:sugar lactone lactonase YvrE
MTRTHTVVSGLGMGESARWHDGRFWFADWAARTISVIDPDGTVRVVTTVPSFPITFDWLPGGRMLVVSGAEARVLVLEGDTLSPYADLGVFATTPWNEIVVDPDGTAWVNGIGYAYPGPAKVAGSIARIAADGTCTLAAMDLAFPNGMAITADGSTLIVAESHAGFLTAFDITGSSLVNRRVWARVDGSAPDGICFGDGGVWFADVPNRSCTLVAESGAVLDTIRYPDGAFSCVVGDGVLYAVTADHANALNPAAPKTGKVVASNLMS